MSEQNVNAMLERVLSHVLNDETEEEHSRFLSDIARGDFELELALDRIQRIFAAIPAALPATNTPAFLKDRILARVREEGAVASGVKEKAASPASTISDVLDAVLPAITFIPKASQSN